MIYNYKRSSTPRSDGVSHRSARLRASEHCRHSFRRLQVFIGAIGGMPRGDCAARLLLCLVLVVALGTWVHAHRRVPWVLWGGDETEYADIGRRLGRGEGFTTGIIYPAELLRWGADRAHPSVVRPPLWPLELGMAFALAGPGDAVVHATTLFAYLAVVGAATALATSLAGPWVGALAGLATAISPPVLYLAVLATPEPAFALWIGLTFLLLARAAHPVWIGLACGLTYLTRYNGIALLPVAALLVLWRNRRLAPALACATGFLLVALPWWVRNVLVAGNPFYSLYNLTPYVAPGVISYTKMLIHMLEPDFSSPAAINPWVKARQVLPELLRFWPPASANLVACIGVILAGLRRDRLALGWLALAAATTASIAFAFPRGRYFAPLVPVMIALGAAGWMRYGGRLRLPALVLLLLAPALPPLPPEASDLSVVRWFVAHAEGVRRPTEWAPCLSGRPLVIAEDAPLVNWVSDTVAIWLPASEADLWRITERWPVGFLQVTSRRDVLTPRVLQRFVARPECGPHLWQRRVAAGG